MREDVFSYGESMLLLLTVYFSRSAEQWKHSLHVSSLVPSLRMQGCYSSAPYDITILVMSEEGIILISVMKTQRTEPFQPICMTGVHHVVSGFSEQTGRLAGAGLKYLLLFTLPGATGAQHSCRSVSRGLCKKIKVVGSDLMLFRKGIHGRGWNGVQLPGKGHPPHLPFSLQDTFWFLQPRAWDPTGWSFLQHRLLIPCLIGPTEASKAQMTLWKRMYDYIIQCWSGSDCVI